MKSAIRYDVSEFQDYVKARVISNYYRLPDHAKGAIGVEDCIQDALLYLHKALNALDGFTTKYDGKRSKLTTWIYIVIDSYFSRLVKAQLTKRRATFLIAIDDLPHPISQEENASYTAKLHEAIDKVTKLHLNASPALIDFIAKNIYFPSSKNRIIINRTEDDFKTVLHEYTHKPRKVRCSNQEVFDKRRKEFLALSKRYEVTSEHYRLALSVETR